MAETHAQNNGEIALAQLSDEALAVAAHGGRLEAFEVLLRRYEHPLYRFLCAMVGDPQEAGTLLVQTAVTAYLSVSRFKAGMRARPWLFRMALAQCQARTAKEPKAAPDGPGLLLGLSPSGRSVFALARCAGLEYGEIAWITGGSVAGVKRRMLKACAVLAPGAAAKSVRPYLLGMLESSARTRLEVRMKESEELRSFAEAERKRLEAVDAALAADPPKTLVEQAMSRVQAEHQDRQHAQPWLHAPFYQVAVAIVVIFALAAVLLPILSRSRESARSGSVASNLERLGIALRMYANEHEGNYPSLAPGVWMFDLHGLYPDYIDDLSLLVDPRLPDAKALLNTLRKALDKPEPDYDKAARVAAVSYVYPRWVVRDAAEAAMAVRQRAIDEGQQPSGAALPEGASPRPLAEGVARFFITDINDPGAYSRYISTIPLVFDSTKTGPEGPQAQERILLCLDGHIECVHKDARFPATLAGAEFFPAPERP